MQPYRFSATSWRPVAAVTAVAAVLTIAPVAIAAGLSAQKGDDAKVVETTRTIALGGVDDAVDASVPVRDAAPACDRLVSMSVSAHDFACGDVSISTRSSESVDDVAEFGRRAIRARLLSDAPAPDMTPATTPNAPGITAWTGTPVVEANGNTVRVIALGETDHDRADGDADTDADAEASGEPRTDGVVVMVAGDPEDVDAAVDAILADVTVGQKR